MQSELSARFARCLDFVLKWKGGFVNHPADPGGATNYGITKRTLELYFGRQFNVTDMRNLSKDTAAEIYYNQYWRPIGTLPVGLDLAVFDFGVNAGPERAVRHLRLRQNVKGEIVGSVEEVILKYTAGRMTYYRGLRHWDTFGTGWTNRVNDCVREALNDARRADSDAREAGSGLGDGKDQGRLHPDVSSYTRGIRWPKG